MSMVHENLVDDVAHLWQLVVRVLPVALDLGQLALQALFHGAIPADLICQ